MSGVVLIMRPEAEAPLVVADEVGVEGADGKVIDAFVDAGVVQLSDGQPPPGILSAKTPPIPSIPGLEETAASTLGAPSSLEIATIQQT